jgi:ribbon-helix-helix CopG family protein
MLPFGSVSRKQVLVQLDDGLMARLDVIAKATGVSRSALIRRAAERLIEDIEEDEWDRRYEESYRRTPDDPDEDEALLAIAAQNWLEWHEE